MEYEAESKCFSGGFDAQQKKRCMKSINSSGCKQLQSRVIVAVVSVVLSAVPYRFRLVISRIPVLAPILRGFMNLVVPSGVLSTAEVSAGLLKGYKLELDLRTEKDFWLGSFIGKGDKHE